MTINLPELVGAVTTSGPRPRVRGFHQAIPGKIKDLSGATLKVLEALSWNTSTGTWDQFLGAPGGTPASNGLDTISGFNWPDAVVTVSGKETLITILRFFEADVDDLQVKDTDATRISDMKAYLKANGLAKGMIIHKLAGVH